MKIRPLHDRVIVKRIEEERKSAGGIVIPDTAREKPNQGEVIAGIDEAVPATRRDDFTVRLNRDRVSFRLKLCRGIFARNVCRDSAAGAESSVEAAIGFVTR